MTIEEFIAEYADAQQRYPRWRPGQTLFNVLNHYRPDLSEQIRGKENDPFYARTVEDTRYINCMKFIRASW